VLFAVWALVLPGAAASLFVAAAAALVTGGLLWVMANRLGRFVYRGGKVLEQGIRADAEVLAVLDEASVEVNGNPVLELELEVRPRNKERFTTTVRQMVPKAHREDIGPGRKVPVRIDVADRRRVVIDFPSM
jgi:hypothetical protein